MPDTTHASDDAADARSETLETIPVVIETARLEKRAVETTRAVIRKTVSETDEVLDAVLARQDVEIERVQVGRTVDDAPVARWEGDTFVWPILEEQLVVEKRLVLKEELHIRTKTRQEPVQTVVRLRAEHVTVERVDQPNNPTSQSSQESPK